jgi:hypothetical protein
MEDSAQPNRNAWQYSVKFEQTALLRFMASSRRESVAGAVPATPTLRLPRLRADVTKLNLSCACAGVAIQSNRLRTSPRKLWRTATSSKFGRASPVVESFVVTFGRRVYVASATRMTVYVLLVLLSSSCHVDLVILPGCKRSVIVRSVAKFCRPVITKRDC